MNNYNPPILDDVLISSFYMSNTIEYYNYHKKLMNFFDIPIQYFNNHDVIRLENELKIQPKTNHHHARFIDAIMNLDYKYFIFLDIDSIPLTKDSIYNTIKICKEEECILGNLQFNCRAEPSEFNMYLGRNHLYCSPAYLCISKSIYDKIGKLSAKRDLSIKSHNADVAQGFSAKCDELGIKKILIPPVDIRVNRNRYKWNNDDYVIGIGTTHYLNYNELELYTYHNYCSRMKRHFGYFVEEINNIIGVSNDKTL